MAAGPWPVVLQSHGNGGSRHAGAVLSERLAERGFIVAAPDHVGNTFDAGFSIDGFVEVFLRRPDDLGRVYAHLLDEADDEGSPFFGQLDGTVGLMGHSTGGSTALLAAGGGVSKATISVACAFGQISGLACEIADQTEGDFIYADLDGFPAVDTMVLMAPLSATLLDGPALAGIEAGALVAVGDRDVITPLEDNAGPIHDSLPQPSALAVLEGAGHYGFATLCGVEGLDEALPDAHEECTGAGYLDPDVLVDATEALAGAWLDAHLAGRADEPSLDAVGAEFPPVDLR